MLEPRDELIQAYLDGEATEAQTAEVERLRASDAEFAQLLADYQETQRRIQVVADYELAQYARAHLDLSLPDAPPPRTRPLWPWLAAAAAAILLLFLVSQWLQPRTDDPQYWVAQALEKYPPPSPPAPRERQGQDEPRPERPPSALRQGLAQSHAYLLAQQPDSALAVLATLDLGENASPEMPRRVRLYRALAYLQRQDWPSARRELEFLAESEGLAHGDAREWLRRMGEIPLSLLKITETPLWAFR